MEYHVRVRGNVPLSDDLPIRDEERFGAGRAASLAMFANEPVEATSPEEAVGIVIGKMPDTGSVDEIWLFNSGHAWVFRKDGELEQDGPSDGLLRERFGPDYEVPPELATP